MTISDSVTGLILRHQWRIKKRVVANNRTKGVPRKTPKALILNCFCVLGSPEKYAFVPPNVFGVQKRILSGLPKTQKNIVK